MRADLETLGRITRGSFRGSENSVTSPDDKQMIAATLKVGAFNLAVVPLEANIVLVATAPNQQLEVEFVGLQKFLWICAGTGTLLAGYLSGAPPLLLIALLFIASIPTALLVTSSSELQGVKSRVVV